MQSVPWEKWWSGAGRKPSKRKRGRLELDPEAREKVCAGTATGTAAILLQNSGQCGTVHGMVCRVGGEDRGRLQKLQVWGRGGRESEAPLGKLTLHLLSSGTYPNAFKGAETQRGGTGHCSHVQGPGSAHSVTKNKYASTSTDFFSTAKK